ncbi:MAG: toll/interleukin-1 receptor domain-containing protein [Candidatus Dadabacteria bacterium]|nr:toll/interleukin-1 receptor domain-containing protein [Candidatus Dadabacteria bacterium]
MKLKVFVSHSSLDRKELAGIKSHLQPHDIDLFLAHQDIETSEISPERIKLELQRSHIFVLIANKNSKQSSFCNQEIGFALGLKRYGHNRFIVCFSHDNYAPKHWDLIGDIQGISHANWNDLKERLRQELELLKDNLPVYLSENQPKTDLAIMNLLGAWRESSQKDKLIVDSLLTDRDFDTWISGIRRSMRDSDTSPILSRYGVWQVRPKVRLSLWEAVGDHLSDEHLDSFQKCAVEVLSEPGPWFQVITQEMAEAGSYKRGPDYSSDLREGIAETLALFGNKPQFLKFCSRERVEYMAGYVIRRVLENADWMLWASLKEVLPLLAEAAPECFLDIVEKTLKKTPCPFDRLFLEEIDKGILDGPYMWGLLQALGVVAWREEYLSNVVVVLGGLASRNPDGRLANRPNNLLCQIFQPWFSQTTASFEKQKSAMKALQREYPEIACEILFSFLFTSNPPSAGSRQPWSYPIPDIDFLEIRNSKECRAQIQFYIEQCTEIAINNDDHLIKIADHLDGLNPDCFSKIVEHIESHELTHESKSIIWEKLNDFVFKHRKFSKQGWSLPKEYVERLEVVLDNIAPDDLHVIHSRLFNKRDSDLYEREGDYGQQSKEIENSRQSAIREIVDKDGVSSAIEFAQKVKLPFHVGRMLGSFVEDKEDFAILRECLQSESKNMKGFIHGFIEIKHRRNGWKWVDDLSIEEWTDTQRGLLLRSLPPCEETWERVDKWLQDEGEYWRNLQVFAYLPLLNEKQIQICVDKCLKFKRPISALNCLHWAVCHKYPLPCEQSIQALLEAVSIGEGNMRIDPYNTAQIITNLQSDPAVDVNELYKVEWAYLQPLKSESDYSPKNLEHKLAHNPEFFHKVICTTFKPPNATKEQSQLTKEQLWAELRSLSLLQIWKIPPGTQEGGTFSSGKFTDWLECVLKLCEQSDHIEVAQEAIGQVLMHSPKDPGGLWIHKSIAEELNKPDRKHMRRGLSMAFFNSRGTHWFDPSGKTERNLIDKYEIMADDIDKEGFQRLATTMRELAKEWEREYARHQEFLKDR